MGNKPIAVVVMSGGMDSTVCTAIAINQGFEIAGLHLNYGQRTEKKELECFNQIADFYNIDKRLIINFTELSQIGGSSLTDIELNIPEVEFERQEIPNTYVPFRNSLILSMAVAWAEVLKANAVFIGAVEEDSSGYPDCRKIFFDAFQEVINFGTKPETEIKLHTPLINMSKKDIVLTGNSLGVPFELTWSCYKSSTIACGECDSCALRLRGFYQAGLKDPLHYERTIKFD